MARVIPEKINRDIQECVTELRKDFFENKIPINDDNANLHRFCFKLEFLLQNDMKEHTSLLGTRKNYWDYICRCLTTKRTDVHDGLKFVKSISELKTSLGRGRAFIRFCLMQQCLADSLQCCIMNTKVTSNWYHESSFLMNEAQTSFLISTLYELNDIQFDLSPRGHDLDVSWPTFARKLFSTTYSWQPPSRSVSVSSLVSCTSQNEPTLTQQFTNEIQNINEVKDLKAELIHLEKNMEELRQQLKCAEKREEESRLLASKKEKELIELSSSLEEERKLHKINVNNLEEEMVKLKENWQIEKNDLVEKLNNSVRTSVENCEKLQHMVSDYNIEEENHLRNCEKLKEKILYLEEENSTLLSQSFHLEVELQKNKEMIQQLETSTKDFEQIISELENENKMFKTRIKEQDTIIESQQDITQSKPFKDLAKQLHLRELDLLTARKEASNLQRTLEKADEANEVAKTLANTLDSENRNLREEISILVARTDDFEKINNDLKDEITAIKLELQNVLESKKKLEEELETVMKLPEELLSIIGKIANSPELSLKDVTNLYRFENIDCSLKEKIYSTLQLLERFNVNCVQNISVPSSNEALNFDKEVMNLCKKQSVKIEELHKEFDACIQEILKLNCQMCIVKDTLHLCEDRINYECLQTEYDYIKETEENECKSSENSDNSTNIPLNEMNNNTNKLNKLTEKTQKLFHDLEAFRELNHKLILKVQEQERKLSGITQELETSHKVITALKCQHSELQTTEAITRYELKEKRKLLNKLRSQLESTKEECNRMRKSYSDSEAEWQSLRDEFAKRHKQASEESGFVDDSKTLVDNESDNQDLIATNSDVASSPIDINTAEMTECFENLRPSCEGAEADINELIKEEVMCNPKSRLERLEEEFKKVRNNIMRNVSRSAHLEQRVQSLRVKKSDNITDGHLGENSAVLLQQSSHNSLDNHEQKTVDDPDTSLQILGTSPISDGIHDTSEEIVVDISNHSSEMSEDIEPSSMNVYDPSSGSLCDLSDLDDENFTNQEVRPIVPSLRRQMLHSVVNRLRNEKLRQECTETELRLQIESLKDSNYNLRREVEKLEQEKTDLIAKEIDFRIVVDVSNHSSEISEDIEPSSMNVYDPSSGSLCDLSDLDDENFTNQEVRPIVPSLRRQMLHSVVNRLRNEKLRQECTETELRLQIESLKDSNYNLRREVEKLEQEKTDLIAKEIDFRKRSEYIFRKERENFHDINVEKCTLERKISELTESLQSAVDRIKDLEKENREAKEELNKIQKLKDEEVSALRFQLSTESLKHERAFKHYTDQENEIANMKNKICDQEDLILFFEDALNQIKEEREIEKKHHRHEVWTLMELDKEKNVCSAYKTELIDLKSQKDQNATELTQLRSDNMELKKKVIKLIKEKDMLWKHSDKLAHQQKIQVTDRWMEDAETNTCLGCKVTFSLIVRKHHCRLCGRIFCHNCANNWLLTASSRRETRVCGECYIKYSELQTECRSTIPSVTEDSEDEESEACATQRPSVIGRMISSGGNFDSENTSVLSDSISVSSLSASAPKNSTVSISSTLPMYGSVPNLPSLCANKWSSHDNQLDQEKKQCPPEEFDIISDEEIANSLSLFNPYVQTTSPGRKADSRLHTTITRNATDIKLAGPNGIKGELWVNAGTQYGVPIVSDLAGHTLLWEFSTEPKTIGFSVVYNKSKSDIYNKLEMQPLLRMVHVDTQRHPFEGYVTMEEPGVYLLIFDNRFSRVTAKKVKYFLMVRGDESRGTDRRAKTLP
ncbi:FYVE and coiled-coil domain-containing protein 1-like [Centruroides sculpturatus]|uniref:FYVE and coiled-coil domain-containing protein 1-like n=1 Tax=Centruroides sculpturatus TaxID=218467 RepID=UPI000C6D0B8C|nr:FYVE and coiled-coil domain-containing protein 1-like [Centruroides sculpturatus]